MVSSISSRPDVSPRRRPGCSGSQIRACCGKTCPRRPVQLRRPPAATNRCARPTSSSTRDNLKTAASRRPAGSRARSATQDHSKTAKGTQGEGARRNHRPHRSLPSLDGEFFKDRAGRRADDAREVARAHLHVRGTIQRLRPLDPDVPCKRPGRGRTTARAGRGSRPSWVSSRSGAVRSKTASNAWGRRAAFCRFPAKPSTRTRKARERRSAVSPNTSANGPVTCGSSGY